MRTKLGVLVLLVLASCATARERTIRVAFTSTNVARDGFVAWDRAHQLTIVEQAATREEAASKIASYRERRAKVVDAFEATYRTIAAAAIVEASHDLESVVQAGRLLQQALIDLGVIKP